MKQENGETNIKIQMQEQLLRLPGRIEEAPPSIPHPEPPTPVLTAFLHALALLIIILRKIFRRFGFHPMY